MKNRRRMPAVRARGAERRDACQALISVPRVAGAAGAAGVAGAVERTDGCAGTMTSTGSVMAHGAIAKPTGYGIGIASALANAMCWSAIICCCIATICA